MTSYWWLRPSRIAIFVALPIAFSAFMASNSFYRRFGAFNAITTDTFFVIWLSILGFAAGSWLGEILRPSRSTTPDPHIRESNFQPLFFGLAFLATTATIVFLAPILIHPDLVLRILKGDPGVIYIVYAAADKIPGITSQENLFSLVIVLFMIKPQITGCERTRAEVFVLVFVLIITGIKAVVHSERLALIDLMVPLFVLIAGLRRRSFAWALAPIAGVVALFVFFTVTEYFRSWVSFYADKSDSLLGFALERILGYYMTAINNGAYIYQGGHTYLMPAFTAVWLWRLPIPGLASWLQFLAGTRIEGSELLSGLNAEFNNPSGLFAPLIDFGPLFGGIVWIALGYFSGRLYRMFIERRFLGLILFPTWYVGVLDMPRIFYWGDARYFPPLVISLALTFIFLLESQNNRSPGKMRYAVQHP